MKVWLLMWQQCYEGAIVVGIYDSLQKAEQNREAALQRLAEREVQTSDICKFGKGLWALGRIPGVPEYPQWPAYPMVNGNEVSSDELWIDDSLELQ